MRIVIISLFLFLSLSGADEWLEFPGATGKAGEGKKVVFLAGEHEYRAEEYLPMLAQILASHHGFETKVLFKQNEKGHYDPDGARLPGMKFLAEADVIVLGLRFQDWSDEQFQMFQDAIDRGVSIISTRTSTHAFKTKNQKWAHYSFNSNKKWKGGFGREVLGETWVSHHGIHGKEGTLTVAEKGQEGAALLNGVGEIEAPTDVYGADPNDPEEILLRGLVTDSILPGATALKDSPKNNPTMPVAWTKLYENEAGKVNKVFTTTLGSGIDFLDEDLRRLVVNAVYWGASLDVPEKAEVGLVSSYEPQHFKPGLWRRNAKPADFSELTDPGFTLQDVKKKPENNPDSASLIKLEKGDSIVLIGGGFFSRMNKMHELEVELHLRHPQHRLRVRNQADEGSTPCFRPHASRDHEYQYAFPGAIEWVPEPYQRKVLNAGEGFHPSAEEWLERAGADVILACFGGHEHFQGKAGLEGFEGELQAYVRHTKARSYNGESPPQLVLVTPPALQEPIRSGNKTLAMYVEVIKKVGAENTVPVVDLFSATRGLERKSSLTHDGFIYNRQGYKMIAPILADAITGHASVDESRRAAVYDAVKEKDWVWHQYFKVPNGVHVAGKRHKGIERETYPPEIRKLRRMVSVRDKAIYAAVAGREFSLADADKSTGELPDIETNFTGESRVYKAGSESINTFTTAEGYQLSLFADESRFPNLANPSQITFDNQGRLWVGVMPSYPHWKPGDPKPNDKLLIYTDTNGDGVADHEQVFADGLHLMTGFDLVKNKQGQQEVYCAQDDSLVRLVDTNGDDVADVREVLLSGFDDHDSHHKISAFYTDPGGGIIMSEGIFLLSSVESSEGVVRGTNGGFFRYDVRQKKLTRSYQASVLNPWGTVYDDYGQGYFLNTSSPALYWMEWGSAKPIYGYNPGPPNILISNLVRPTSGLEIISSDHFPEEVQGDIILGNVKGFRGVKQHRISLQDAHPKAMFRQDLLSSMDPNVRVVDMEFAPDGSLYIADWHNILVGHMQHSSRDPLRDHVHGRIYRMTYPSRPLVKPAPVAGASIADLLQNLATTDARTRYRSRNELRSRPMPDVMDALQQWLPLQNKDQVKLEGLWVSWSQGVADYPLMRELMKSQDHRVRVAVIQVLRHFSGSEDAFPILKSAAADPHGSVRLAALNSASYLSKEEISTIVKIAKKSPEDGTLKNTLRMLESHQKDVVLIENITFKRPSPLKKDMTLEQRKAYNLGYNIYHAEGSCATCHGKDGTGIPAAGFPPLKGSEWVKDSPDKLTKIVLHGVMGPINVAGKEYNSAMAGFSSRLNDEEIAAVLNYVTLTWGQENTDHTEKTVQKVRRQYEDRLTPWTAKELSR